jgi:hypothetical protein
MTGTNLSANRNNGLDGLEREGDAVGGDAAADGAVLAVPYELSHGPA